MQPFMNTHAQKHKALNGNKQFVYFKFRTMQRCPNCVFVVCIRVGRQSLNNINDKNQNCPLYGKEYPQVDGLLDGSPPGLGGGRWRRRAAPLLVLEELHEDLGALVGGAVEVEVALVLDEKDTF